MSPEIRAAIDLLAREGYTVFGPGNCKQAHLIVVRADASVFQGNLIQDIRISFAAQLAHFAVNEITFEVLQSKKEGGTSPFTTFSSSLFLSKGPAL